MDRALHEKIQGIINELYDFGAENRLSLGWLCEAIRDRLLNHPDADIQAYVAELRRKKLN
jgi:hypothetical protein